jgi:hypothetical protein
MTDQHLSVWEQDEYILEASAGQQSPRTMRHLAECSQCRAAVENLEQGIAGFKAVATQWSAQQLAQRPQALLVVPARRLSAFPWAFAAMIPVLLCISMLIPFHSKSTPRPATQISADALMDQVDEQVSVAVPSSMESLTHLVTSSGPAE